MLENIHALQGKNHCCLQAALFSKCWDEIQKYMCYGGMHSQSFNIERDSLCANARMQWRLVHAFNYIYKSDSCLMTFGHEVGTVMQFS